MDISPKSKEVTTELGAIAVCITSTVGFMIGAAYAKALFTQWEWWFFFVIGLGWLTWMATHFRKTHEFGFLWREHRLLSDNLRKTGESYVGALKNLDALAEKKVACLQGSALGPAPSVEPDQHGHGEEKEE